MREGGGGGVPPLPFHPIPPHRLHHRHRAFATFEVGSDASVVARCASHQFVQKIRWRGRFGRPAGELHLLTERRPASDRTNMATCATILFSFQYLISAGNRSDLVYHVQQIASFYYCCSMFTCSFYVVTQNISALNKSVMMPHHWISQNFLFHLNVQIVFPNK